MGSIAPSERSIDRTLLMRLSLATAAIAAGLIHSSVVPHHLEESTILGVAFVATAIFQIAWAVTVSTRLDRRLLDVGAAVNGAVVAAWIVTRTIGLPFRPDAWLAEPVGAIDAAATLPRAADRRGAGNSAHVSAGPWKGDDHVETRPGRRNAVTYTLVEDRVERSQRARIAVQRSSRSGGAVCGKARRTGRCERGSSGCYGRPSARYRQPGSTVIRPLERQLAVQVE